RRRSPRRPRPGRPGPGAPLDRRRYRRHARDARRPHRPGPRPLGRRPAPLRQRDHDRLLREEGGGMSRVLLVNPRMCSPRSVRLPLALLALGAVLEGRHDYRIVDGNLDSQAVDTVLALLAEAPGALLAVTVMPGPQVATAIEVSAAVRLAHPEVPIAWG